MTARLARRGFLAGAAGAAAGLLAGTGLGMNAQAMTTVPGRDESAWRLFGHEGVRVPGGAARHAAWRETLRARPGGSPAWQSLVAQVRRRGGSDLRHLVSATNALLNSLPYRSDRARFRRSDRWLDPESFLRAGGDCEDFAIAKYFLLRGLEVPAEQLRLVTGYDREGARAHALLAARVGGRVLVLDNRYRWPQPEDGFAGFRPRLAFNESGLWLYR